MLFLLASASENSERFATHYNALLAVNGTIVAALMALVGYQILRLLRNFRRGVFGSRLMLRLVLFFSLIAVLPGALVYGVSVQFLGRSIESWFDVRIDRALEGALTLGQGALDDLLGETTNRARQMALALGEDESGNLSARLNRLREQAGLYEAAIYTERGNLLVFSSESRLAMAPQAPAPTATRRTRLQQSQGEIETLPDLGLVLRISTPVVSIDPLDPGRILQVLQLVPKKFQENAEIVQTGFRDYQELSFARQGLKRLYGLTLTLTLLLALMSALALAVYLSERFSAPLALLAEGTRAVAQGDFSRRPQVQSRDELGVLTQSFNEMTAQLDEARQREAENRRAIETANAYLEGLLGNLTAGVMALDRAYRLRAVNPSAAVILQQPLPELRGLALEEWADRLPALAEFCALVREGFAASPDGQWQKQAELTVSAITRALLLRGTRLPESVEGGYIVVFDDVSELAQAQRDAAWAEVARRLAHEIKNPLTPIQLSAERMQKKLAEHLQGAEAEALTRGTRTIVTQVAAMKQMVDDFGVYARQARPGAQQAVDLNQLLPEVLGLYENQGQSIRLVPSVAPVIIQGEPTRLRQVIHNLLQNALDAQNDQPHARTTIATETDAGVVRLVFEDEGSGFPEEILQRAFEPYVTSKPKGTGLGLAIVKKIVDEHRGRISIENRRPQGARIVMQFPAFAPQKST
ncbi:MAG: HAMP domain-containing protein [Betaproteobacteria bacterium]|nr:HAMP domain-containing protein [Betaproteobacteria bacterium]